MQKAVADGDRRTDYDWQKDDEQGEGYLLIYFWNIVYKRLEFLAVIVGLLSVGCMSSPTKFNSPPVITSLKAVPATISIGEASLISASAYDPEGKSVSFNWSCNQGYFIGTGSEVKYTVPVSCCAGVDEITVIVKDSQNQETKKIVKIMISAG